MCPFLVVAFWKGVGQVPVVGDGKVRPEVTCCREDCQWWQGGRCAMQSIAERLDKLGDQLSRLYGESGTA